MDGKRATQKDVAQLAGVSQATVSMVLSGQSSAIPKETLTKIISAAEELGYTPNRFARGLKTNKSMTIACVVPEITNPFYPELIRGIQSVTDSLGYDVIAYNTNGSPEREQQFLGWARQGVSDGAIGVFFTLKSSDFVPLTDAGVPIVRVESSKKRSGSIPIDDLYVDSHEASYTITQYLISKGHSRISTIAGRGGPQSQRIEGYKSAMREAGGEPNVTLDDNFDEEGGFRAAQVVLASDYKPTAIFAANDLMAIGVMQALREQNINIPGDIAVVGFDDIPAAKFVTPSLTTIAQFQYQIGIKAAQILIGRLRGSTTGAGTALEMPFSLVERASA